MKLLCITITVLCLVGCTGELQTSAEDMESVHETEVDDNYNKYDAYANAIIEAYEGGALSKIIAEPDIWGRPLTVMSNDTWTVIKSSGASIVSDEDDIVITLWHGFHIKYRYNGASFAYSDTY